MHEIARRAIETTDPITDLVAAFYGDDGPLTAMGWDIRPQQRDMSTAIADNLGSKRWGMVEAPCGCHAAGQLVMLHDGSLVKAEDVRVGDALMGPDGNPRKVVSLARGEQAMYDIVPAKGEPWRVNEGHVMTVLVPEEGLDQCRTTSRVKAIDVSLRDYLSWSKSRRRAAMLMRTGVDFPAGDSLAIPPYILGVLLGDGYLPGTPGTGGTKSPIQVATKDTEIVLEVQRYAGEIGMRLRRVDDRHYSIVGKQGYGNNALRSKLRDLGLSGTRSGTKFIPQTYQTASRRDRMELLAGLIDTDGSNNGCGGFDYLSKSEDLARGVAFVARSLGLAAYIQSVQKSSQTGYVGDYWRVSISGHCSEVPVRLERKRPSPRRINKDPLHVGFKAVASGTVEQYYGFTLSGDGRFLLGDFTVTHNTGKGLAYLVPGVLAVLRGHAEHAAKVAAAKANPDPGKNGPGDPPKLVISTANIALQEQLMRKDIPALGAMLGVDLRAIMLKSVGNYVCRKSVRALGPKWINDDRTARVLRLMEDPAWTGDKEDLDWDPGDLWPAVSVSSEDCAGKSCPHYRKGYGASWCFWRKAIQGRAKAHILVMNHHYLALSRAPKNVFLAVDEAHELESAMRSAVSKTITPFSGAGVANRARKWLGDDATSGIARPVESIMDDLHSYYRSKIRKGTDATVLKPGWCMDHSRELAALKSTVQEVLNLCTARGCYLSATGPQPPNHTAPDAEEAASLVSLWRAVIGLYERCWSLVHVEPYPGELNMRDGWPGDPWAIYAEADRRDRVLAHMAPADVSWATRTMWARYPDAVLTSATLPEYTGLRLTLGMAEPGEKSESGSGMVHGPNYETRLPSPFPLKEMGALVVPNGPGPKDEGWRDWACDQVVEAVQQAKGRTLVLCTSYRQMTAYTEALRERVPEYPVKRQGEEGRGALREWFRDTVDGVLVASRSFFQGLDVQGDSLSCVVIDRIPFSRPGDPVEDAVQRLLEDRAGGGNGFMLRSVPQASMVLAQGAGRLIRGMSDRGCVVMLDNRIIKPHGCWPVLKGGLPPFPVSRDIADVGNVLDGNELIGRPAPPRGRAPSGRRRRR